ncbi:hypothetical protein ACQUJT_25065, partial [Ralstonia pseudosolanacearum]
LSTSLSSTTHRIGMQTSSDCLHSKRFNFQSVYREHLKTLETSNSNGEFTITSAPFNGESTEWQCRRGQVTPTGPLSAVSPHRSRHPGSGPSGGAAGRATDWASMDARSAAIAGSSRSSNWHTRSPHREAPRPWARDIGWDHSPLWQAAPKDRTRRLSIAIASTRLH